MIGAENSGKSCLIASFIGEAFIEEQKATDGADTEVCKIYCRNWTKMTPSDITDLLQHQFISQFKESADKAKCNYESGPYALEERPSTKFQVNSKDLPQPDRVDVNNATSYTPTNDPDSLNAVMWDFAGQVILYMSLVKICKCLEECCNFQRGLSVFCHR